LLSQRPAAYIFIIRRARLLLALVILLTATTLEATIADSKIYRLSMTEQIDQFFRPNGTLISNLV
jgi:hypothetical protein